MVGSRMTSDSGSAEEVAVTVVGAEHRGGGKTRFALVVVAPATSSPRALALSSVSCRVTIPDPEDGVNEVDGGAGDT